MCLFAGFFDQDAHLRVGGFEVDGEIVVAQAFAGGNTMTQRYLVLKEVCGNLILTRLGRPARVGSWLAWLSQTRSHGRA